MCFFPKARFGFTQRVKAASGYELPIVHLQTSSTMRATSSEGLRWVAACVRACVCVRTSIYTLTPIRIARTDASAQAQRRAPPQPPARNSRSACKNCRQLPQRRPRGSLPFSKIHGYFKNISSFKLSCLDNLHYSSVSRLMAPSHGAK